MTPSIPSTAPDRVRVLVVEDDEAVRVTTSLVLRAHGFEVDAVEGGLQALERIASHGAPDVAVVDVAMPGLDGIRLTRRLREEHDLPIVLLTARDLPTDVVAGLDAGADDYVTKPFDGEVLAARLRAVVRRRPAAASSPAGLVGLPGPPAAPARAVRTVRLGRIELDPEALVVTLDGVPVALSATELRLLEYLAGNVGRVVSRGQILEAVWGDSSWTDARVVDTNVGRLRAKLDPAAIETVRGFGYKLVVP
ncbi:response regulator transcription factor [Nocardioides sp. TRM66260-LWL]|uniref:response regulator transcription factor n=1 Tax=Nocardioides sp. TRM66260-LWL TaxID=2874478 RepID=UPI001CC50B6F|nr:response regulator transcription factor [Nocardioides sp. TRM66260-LWL]MBZ5735891.1 response regulator transcription factor [Nocardioides sp. TRM66260-LWL]